MASYVLADNGLLYCDPVLSGDGWFLVFDGYDEPEIVLDARGLDATAARLRALQILEQSGISAVLSGPPRYGDRAFDRGNADRRRAYAFWITVSDPIPSEALELGSVGVTQPAGDSLVLAFGRSWG